MSNYTRRTKNPRTGEFEDAEWIDDYFGRHQYGVHFPSDTTDTSVQEYYHEDSHVWEFEDEATLRDNNLIGAYTHAKCDQALLNGKFSDACKKCQAASVGQRLPDTEPNQDKPQISRCRSCTHALLYAELQNSLDLLAYCPNKQCARYGLFTMEEGEL